MFATLNVCVPYVPKSTVFVSPTLYLLILLFLTALIIVFHESVANELGAGISLSAISVKYPGLLVQPSI